MKKLFILALGLLSLAACHNIDWEKRKEIHSLDNLEIYKEHHESKQN